ncbi:MAG: DUF4040 domain-containing protein [Nitrospirota bacterium]|nr:MAG: DUF4040 domain-containing protein [Nitrospirota bacterium]
MDEGRGKGGRMIWQIDLMVLTLIVFCAFSAVMVKDLLSAAIIFGAYSFLMCLLWTEMGAVDVAFTEAAVGAGVSTIFMIAAIFRTSRSVKHRSRGRRFYKLIGFFAAAVTGMVLLYGQSDFPGWADPNSPASSHLSPYFITHTISDTAVPNIVTSVLADYRGFDTMFETAVIFTAGIAVIFVLRQYRRDQTDVAGTDEVAYQSPIIQTVSRQMVPFIQLFALYVVAHGHHSPGGGFQGGVILGASFILVGLSYDLRSVLKKMGEGPNIIFGNLGVFLYAGIGAVCILLGANFLDYSVLSRILPATDSVMARSHGILGVEIGVAIAVMAIMIAIYVNISSHGKYDKGL